MASSSFHPLFISEEKGAEAGLEQTLGSWVSSRIQNDKIDSILIAASEEKMENEINVESRTELDSHANMSVVGKHAYIIAETGKKVKVSPFTPDYQPLTVPLVDAAVRYDNPYNGKLVLQNTLYVPSMENNLIPPFMLREMGVTVNDVPKIHKDDPTVDDHVITFMETGFRIYLSFWGIFLYFPCPNQLMTTCLTQLKYTFYPQPHGTHTPMHTLPMRSPCWIGKEACNKERTINIVLFLTMWKTI